MVALEAVDTPTGTFTVPEFITCEFFSFLDGSCEPEADS